MTDKVTIWGVGTPRTFRPYWALEELNVQYQSHAIITRTSDMESSEFLAISPGKKIPALQHRNLTLTESGAITRYLYDHFSDTEWSTEEQAQINRWIYFSLMELDATALYVLRRHKGLPQIYGEAPNAVASAQQYASRQLDVLNDWFNDGRQYVAGERFSEADIHVTSCLMWCGIEQIEIPELLKTYNDRMIGRDACMRAFAVNFEKH